MEPFTNETPKNVYVIYVLCLWPHRSLGVCKDAHMFPIEVLHTKNIPKMAGNGMQGFCHGWPYQMKQS